MPDKIPRIAVARRCRRGSSSSNLRALCSDRVPSNAVRSIVASEKLCIRPRQQSTFRESGGIGRRAGFRIQCPEGRGGSSPPSRISSHPDAFTGGDAPEPAISLGVASSSEPPSSVTSPVSSVQIDAIRNGFAASCLAPFSAPLGTILGTISDAGFRPYVPVALVTLVSASR